MLCVKCDVAQLSVHYRFTQFTGPITDCLPRSTYTKQVSFLLHTLTSAGTISVSTGKIPLPSETKLSRRHSQNDES